MKVKVYTCAILTAIVVSTLLCLLEKFNMWLANEIYRVLSWFLLGLMSEIIVYHFVFERRK